MNTTSDDRIFPITRGVLAVVIVALLIAFLILYLNPQLTKQHFAWEVVHALTAVFMGAGYVSGAYLFIFAVIGKKWHHIAHGFLPVSTFAGAMLIATFLHYDRFIHENLAFVLWFGLYFITPFLIPWLWIRNRKTDPLIPEAGDRLVPKFIRWTIGTIGIISLAFWVVNFINPPLLIAIWPWKLSPLTTRVVSGFGMLVGVGATILSREQRWSAWRYTIQSIALWQVLMVFGCLVHRQDFVNGSLVNFYFIGIILVLIILSLLYLGMESGVLGQRQSPDSQKPSV